MKHQIKPIFISTSLLLLLLLLLNSNPTRAQEVEDESEFDYIQGSKRGPKFWGEIKEEWRVCSNGTMQSPIDMTNDRVKVIRNSVELRRRYKPAEAIVRNRGHDITVQWLNFSAGSIRINGTDYLLNQGHWHSPSEHTINGRSYALELHMVHLSQDPKVKHNIAVVGVLYKFGRPDPFLSKLIKSVMPLADRLTERNLGVVHPRRIRMGGKKYYRYMGSLTVPPCTEGVIWTLKKKVMTVSRAQVRALRIAVKDYAEVNARPLQPINKRRINLHDPEPECQG